MKKKKLDAALLLKLPTETKAAVDVLAQRLDRSSSWVIRHAIEQLLEREKQNG